ncbi:hypothetical protein GEMRC1_003244 [Eukaryota sp. GEM-RC1]
MNPSEPLPSELFCPTSPEPALTDDFTSADLLNWYKEHYRKEQQKVSFLLKERENFRQHIVDLGIQVEKEEEFITNKLLRQLHKVEEEKEALKNELLIDTDGSNLQPYLDTITQLRREKVEIEHALEKEHESLILRLHRQLTKTSPRQRRLSRSESISDSEYKPM